MKNVQETQLFRKFSTFIAEISSTLQCFISAILRSLQGRHFTQQRSALDFEQRQPGLKLAEPQPAIDVI